MGVRGQFIFYQNNIYVEERLTIKSLRLKKNCLNKNNLGLLIVAALRRRLELKVNLNK